MRGAVKVALGVVGSLVTPHAVLVDKGVSRLSPPCTGTCQSQCCCQGAVSAFCGQYGFPLCLRECLKQCVTEARTVLVFCPGWQ